MKNSQPYYFRNPRLVRFMVPNDIWELSLTPPEFVIICYIYFRSKVDKHLELDGKDPLPPVSLGMLAANVHLGVDTIKKYVNLLVRCEMLDDSLKLTLITERKKDNRFFSLPDGIFALGLKPSAFMVYAHLLLCEDRKKHVSCVSYNTICGATHLSKGTVVKAIADLEGRGMIEKTCRSWINHQGLKLNAANAYRIHSFDRVLRRIVVEELNQVREQLAWSEAKKKLNVLPAYCGDSVCEGARA